MTDAELEVLEALAKAATPGPWDWNGGDVVSATAEDIINPEDCFSTSENNCAFIAAANPATVLELIQELRQARAIAEASYGMVKDAVDRVAAKEAVSCQAKM